MKVKYKVTLENGDAYIWEFIEQHRENDYGNGNYVGVKLKNEIVAVMDMRYEKYNLFTLSLNYIKSYYGYNFLKAERME